ncbi:MAG TPA: hypothetical protein VGM50_08835 [Gemmatimonadaceae bacterium]
MFIPLVDALRCPRPHAETWLVASIDRAEDRDILDGTLGCPQCLAEYPIRDGVVYFNVDIVRTPFLPPDEVEATRLAAALDLTEANMTAVLHGDWGAHAQLIRAMSPAQILLVNPPDGVLSGDGISIVVADKAPLAQSSAHAVAIDNTANEEMIASLVAALASGRRMLGPVTLPLPQHLTQLVRDEDVWVAQLDTKVTVSAPIGLTRKPR